MFGTAKCPSDSAIVIKSDNGVTAGMRIKTESDHLYCLLGRRQAQATHV